MVLQKQMYQTVRVYYGVRPAAAWENDNVYVMQKATFKYHLGHIFKHIGNLEYGY